MSGLPVVHGTLNLNHASYFLASRSHEAPSSDPWKLRFEQPRPTPSVALAFHAAHGVAVAELRDPDTCSMAVACRTLELQRGPAPSSSDDILAVFEVRARLLSERARATAPLRSPLMRGPGPVPHNLLLRRDGGRDAHDQLVTLREAPKLEAAPVAEAPQSLSERTAYYMSEKRMGYAEAFAEASRTLRAQTSR
jgi:hypothetical protein